MFVKERMSHPVITAYPDTSLQEAMHLLQSEHIRRLPVVDKHGELVGIVTDHDLLRASPSDVTSLSVWEIGYLLSKITLEKVMIRDVVTIDENTPIEEAACIMADHKFGALPVTSGKDLVGIITDTDIFKVFMELFNAREAGVRVTALVKNEPGQLSRLSKAIYDAGGNIIAMGTYRGPTPAEDVIMLKVDGVDAFELDRVILPNTIAILDIRQMPGV